MPTPTVWRCPRANSAYPPRPERRGALLDRIEDRPVGNEQVARGVGVHLWNLDRPGHRLGGNTASLEHRHLIGGYRIGGALNDVAQVIDADGVIADRRKTAKFGMGPVAESVVGELVGEAGSETADKLGLLLDGVGVLAPRLGREAEEAPRRGDGNLVPHRSLTHSSFASIKARSGMLAAKPRTR